jgi:hypothetical protein
MDRSDIDFIVLTTPKGYHRGVSWEWDSRATLLLPDGKPAAPGAYLVKSWGSHEKLMCREDLLKLLQARAFWHWT